MLSGRKLLRACGDIYGSLSCDKLVYTIVDYRGKICKKWPHSGDHGTLRGDSWHQTPCPIMQEGNSRRGGMHCVVLRLQETKEARQRRIEEQKSSHEFRSERFYRRHGRGARQDVQVANIFLALGLNYLELNREEAFQKVPEVVEGKRVDEFSKKALRFLRDNFDAEQVEDSEGRLLLHIPAPKQGEQMNIYRELADRSGLTRKVCKALYESLVKLVRRSLKEERRIRLPEFGIVAVRYRKARPKRKGINPFTRKKTTFKAKPASNKLKFRPSKELKEFVGKLAVIPPKKKHHKKRHKKH